MLYAGNDVALTTDEGAERTGLLVRCVCSEFDNSISEAAKSVFVGDNGIKDIAQGIIVNPLRFVERDARPFLELDVSFVEELEGLELGLPVDDCNQRDCPGVVFERDFKDRSGDE